MKKLLILLIALLPVITVGCNTLPKTHEIVLPPKPQRETRPEVKTMKDVGELVNYYETLVKLWELWGADVDKEIENINK